MLPPWHVHSHWGLSCLNLWSDAHVFRRYAFNLCMLPLQVTPGVGFVFVAFSDTAASVKAQKALHGRMFGENKIEATYYNEQLIDQKVFS